MAKRSSRLPIVFATVVVVAIAGFFGVRAILHVAQQQLSYPHCDVGDYEIDTDQAAVAATMVGAVTRFRPALPERAAVLVLAAGLQESKLTNLPPGAGDRDSVGVLQQRPSQGWGNYSAARLTSVSEATREFLAALIKVPHWRTLPLAEAIQDVQISADGSAYAKHEGEAQALADALQGHRPAALTCSFGKPSVVASTARVVGLLRRDLPVNPPVTSGRTITVPGAAWQTAAWFVAYADRLGIDSVTYGGKRWTRADGWRPDPAVGSGAVVATMAQPA